MMHNVNNRVDLYHLCTQSIGRMYFRTKLQFSTRSGSSHKTGGMCSPAIMRRSSRLLITHKASLSPRSPLLREWMNEWVSEWVNEWMKEGRKEERKEGRNERTNERKNERTNERMIIYIVSHQIFIPRNSGLLAPPNPNYTVFDKKKTTRYLNAHDFGKCWPIFKNFHPWTQLWLCNELIIKDPITP